MQTRFTHLTFSVGLALILASATGNTAAASDTEHGAARTQLSGPQAINELELAVLPPEGEGIVVTGTCTRCTYAVGKHWFGATTCTGSGNGCFGCEDTPAGHIGCHAFEYNGECSPSGHSPCGATLAYEDAIMEALGRSDLHSVVSQITGSMGQVMLSDEVNGLLIAGCKGGIASYIPLSERALSRLRALQLTTALGLESAWTL